MSSVTSEDSVQVLGEGLSGPVLAPGTPVTTTPGGSTTA